MTIFNNTTSSASWTQTYKQGTGETNWTRIFPEVTTVIDTKDIKLDPNNTSTTNARIINSSNVPLPPNTPLYFSSNSGNTISISPNFASEPLLIESDLTKPLTSRIGVYNFSGLGDSSFTKILFSDDGKKLFTYNMPKNFTHDAALILEPYILKEYTLSIPWDISTAVLQNTHSLPDSYYKAYKFGVSFAKKGKSIVVCYITDDQRTVSGFYFKEYAMGIPYDLSTLNTTPIKEKTLTKALDSDRLRSSSGNNNFVLTENTLAVTYAENDTVRSILEYWTINDWDIDTASNKITRYFQNALDNDRKTYALRCFKDTFLQLYDNGSTRVIVRVTGTVSVSQNFLALTFEDFISFASDASEAIANYTDFYISNDWRYLYLVKGGEITAYDTFVKYYSYTDVDISQLGFIAPPKETFLLQQKPTLIITSGNYTINDNTTSLTKVSSSTTQYVATGEVGSYKNSSTTDTLLLSYTDAGVSNTITVNNNNSQNTYYYSINFVNTTKQYTPPGGSTTSSITFSNDGTKLYTSYYLNPTNYLTEHTLQTPWDIASTKSNEKIITAIGFYGQLQFSNDGTKLFIKSNNENLKQYNLTTPWDINSITNITSPDSLAAIGAFAGRDAKFSKNGQYLFVVNTTTDVLVRYTLQTPWDPSVVTETLTSVDFGTLGYFDISDDGKYLFYTYGGVGNSIYMREFTSPWSNTFSTAEQSISLTSFNYSLSVFRNNLYVNSSGAIKQYRIPLSYYNPFTVTESPAGTYTIQFQQPLLAQNYTLQYSSYTSIPDTLLSSGSVNTYTTPDNVIYQNNGLVNLIYNETNINANKLDLTLTGPSGSYVTELKLNLRKSL